MISKRIMHCKTCNAVCKSDIPYRKPLLGILSFATQHIYMYICGLMRILARRVQMCFKKSNLLHVQLISSGRWCLIASAFSTPSNCILHIPTCQTLMKCFLKCLVWYVSKFWVMTRFLEINHESFKCFNEQVVLWVTEADGLWGKLFFLYPSNLIPLGHVTPHRKASWHLKV